LGEYCSQQNQGFVKCKEGNSKPEACVEQGKLVTGCAVDLFKKVKANCNTEYTTHWKCLEWNNHEFSFCRKEQQAFDGCVFEKLGLGKQRYEELQQGKLLARKKL